MQFPKAVRTFFQFGMFGIATDTGPIAIEADTQALA
jgi:hypothetical protein